MKSSKKPVYLISACLCGEKVRYDGSANTYKKAVELVNSGLAIPFCPEVEGGLLIPRNPAEIKCGKVIDKKGNDVTISFETGAQKALKLCQRHHIKKAILKENSPSCGANYIYDGSFSGVKISGKGLTAKLLAENNIKVYNEHEKLDKAL